MKHDSDAQLSRSIFTFFFNALLHYLLLSNRHFQSHSHLSPGSLPADMRSKFLEFSGLAKQRLLVGDFWVLEDWGAKQRVKNWQDTSKYPIFCEVRRSQCNAEGLFICRNRLSALITPQRKTHRYLKIFSKILAPSVTGQSVC